MGEVDWGAEAAHAGLTIIAVLAGGAGTFFASRALVKDKAEGTQRRAKKRDFIEALLLSSAKTEEEPEQLRAAGTHTSLLLDGLSDVLDRRPPPGSRSD